jgi:hypothetical protein
MPLCFTIIEFSLFKSLPSFYTSFNQTSSSWHYFLCKIVILYSIIAMFHSKTIIFHSIIQFGLKKIEYFLV